MPIISAEKLLKKELEANKNNKEYIFYWNKLQEDPDVDMDELEEEYYKLYYPLIQEAYQGNATIEFYKSPSGKNYVEEFLQSLDSEVREETYNNMALLKKLGAAAKYPLIDNLGDKIFELRTRLNDGSGNTWVRILYFWMPGNIIIMTNGFIKKSNKIPLDEIKIAKKRRNEFLRRK